MHHGKNACDICGDYENVYRSHTRDNGDLFDDRSWQPSFLSKYINNDPRRRLYKKHYEERNARRDTILSNKSSKWRSTSYYEFLSFAFFLNDADIN